MKRSKSQSLLGNQSGAILVYMLALCVVVSVICGIFATSASTLQKKIAQEYQEGALEFQIDQVIRHLRLQGGMGESADYSKNKELRVCVKGGAKDACTENCCESGQNKGFYFTDFFAGGDPESRQALIGPPDDPVYYLNNGRICTATEKTDCDYSCRPPSKQCVPAGKRNALMQSI